MEKLNNQWLTIEMRLCRELFGLTQAEMAMVAGVGLQTIKNMEKAGVKPRVSTLVNLRETFRMMGVKFHVDESDKAYFTFKPAMISAIAQGELSKYTERQLESIKMARSEMTLSPQDLSNFSW
jgi:DNA-binding XRE family transcriptional regulator